VARHGTPGFSFLLTVQLYQVIIIANRFSLQTSLQKGDRMQNNDLSDVIQHVKRYWFNDGLGEVVGGGMILLIGLYFTGQEWLPKSSTGRTLLQSSLILLVIGGTFTTRWLVNLLKTRLTYPRTGYVEYEPGPKNTPLRRVFTAGIAISVSALLVIFGRSFGSFNWLPGFTGLLFGAVFIILRAKSNGIGRFYVLGTFSIILGVALSLSGLSMGYSLGLFYGAVGMASMLSGVITLLRYLRENPLPMDAENE
jgi:hypothetical protein